ncbi:MAG: hypothetical protein JNJ91_00480 [Flavobacteriales bacterium]|nr:hypothetical protein [Flavobacteriales bacterium]
MERTARISKKMRSDTGWAMISLVIALGFSGDTKAQKVEQKTWPNGQVKSEEQLDKKGFKTGVCTYWYENGQMRLREGYERGRRSGPSEGWFEDGTPDFKRNWVVDQRGNGGLGTEPIAVKDGLWEEFYENGQKQKEERFQMGVLVGVVRTWYPNGQLDEMKTMADKFENGPYEKYYEDGTLQVKGSYVNGEKQGEWVWHYPNGQLAYREVFEGDKHIDGPWRGFHANGADSLSGSYANSRREGIWIALHPNGKMKSKTLYRDGMPSGEFVEFYANGNKSMEGAFGTTTADIRRGREEGLWKEWWENGQLKRTVAYDNGQMTGPCSEWYANGQKRFETNYVLASGRDEMMDGMTREWHENGQLMTEGVYVKGMRDGLWKEYYGSGTLRSEIIFDKTKPSGAVIEYFETGQVLSNGFYEVKGRHLKRTGHWTHFYESGQKQSDGEYVSNEKMGRWQEWYANGQKKEDAFFDKGAYDGRFQDFHENGQLRSEGGFRSKEKLKVHANHGFWFPVVLPGFTTKRESAMHGTWKYYDANGDLIRQEVWYNGRKKE